VRTDCAVPVRTEKEEKMGETLREKEDLIKMAIDREIKAYELFMNATERMDYESTKLMLKELAAEEDRHRKMLEKALNEGVENHIGSGEKPVDFKISDNLVTPELSEGSTPQDVMIIAMKMEDVSVEFYRSILPHFKGSAMEGLISRLIREERKHKERLEKEYDEHFLSEM